MDLLEHFVIEMAGIPLKKKYDTMDRFPCAYVFFKLGFTQIVSRLDLWKADVDTSEKNEFRVSIYRCFWNDTFRKYKCPEICQLACQCDELTFGELKHIGFQRTETLGMGGNCCDFHFIKKP